MGSCVIWFGCSDALAGQRPADYAEHILSAIREIEEFTDGFVLETFLADLRTLRAVERCLEIISEASRGIPETEKAREISVPWKSVAGIGNVLRHDYSQVDVKTVWDTITTDLAVLEEATVRIRHRLDKRLDCDH